MATKMAEKHIDERSSSSCIAVFLDTRKDVSEQSETQKAESISRPCRVPHSKKIVRYKIPKKGAKPGYIIYERASLSEAHRVSDKRKEVTLKPKIQTDGSEPKPSRVPSSNKIIKQKTQVRRKKKDNITYKRTSLSDTNDSSDTTKEETLKSKILYVRRATKACNGPVSKKRIEEGTQKKSVKPDNGDSSMNCTPTNVRDGKTKKNTLQYKPVLLCVNLSDDVGSAGDFMGYFRHRLGDKFKTDFKVKNTETISHKEQRCMKVTLTFPSKSSATKARNLFSVSNKHSATKLLPYFPANEERELKVLSSAQIQARFETHLQIIFDRSTHSMDSHEKKIHENIEEQAKQKKKLKGGTLSITDYDCTEAEMKATMEKLQELELQKAEFRVYMDNLYKKLEEIKNSATFDTKVNELRVEFGIECGRLKHGLPIYARRSHILAAVKNYQVSVILGETGSGKSTQIPQYLLEAGYAKDGLIVCTQPRKVAAVTLATHVSREMASNVGQLVGYHVGMKTKRINTTKVIYMTDHILLNECLKDNLLRNFSCIIIDEAHERSIFTDLLLGMIKSAIVKRPALRIVITSATMKPDIFVSYFGGPDKCPVVRVSGRTFPVEDVWGKPEDDEHPFDGHVNAAIQKSLDLHSKNPPAAGDILVFLTTPLEVDKCCEQFVQECPDDNAQCLPFHGKLQAVEQAKVFLDSPPNKRKVVFATNCAETSITIPGVKFVIDTGLAKEMRFDAKRNISSLRVYPISKSSAEQRKGRAGRTSPGKCYRLYSKTVYNSMEDTSKPEILRVDLGQALLKLMNLGIDPVLFDFVESPGQEAIESSMMSLRDIDAVEGKNITDVGRWLSKLPIDPRQGYLVKLGIQKDVPTEALVVAACWGRDIFFRFGSEKEKKEADLRKLHFCHGGGDVLTKLNVYREWDKIPEKVKGKWCFENYINAKSMRGVRELVNEIRAILKKDMNQDISYAMKPVREADLVIKKILSRVLKQNICVFLGHENVGFYSIHNQQHVCVHPSSVLKSLNIQPDVIVYEQILQTSRDFITSITPVDDSDLRDLPSEVLTSYKNTIETMYVSLAGTYYVGKKIARKFIGPFHKNKKEIEEKLKDTSTNRAVVLDVDRVSGEIKLFSSKPDKQHTVCLLRNVLNDLTKPFKQQCIEVNVGKSDGVRIVLGAGSTVIDVLMPHQYRTIMIKKKLLSAYEPEIVEIENIFSPFGEITDIKQTVQRNKRDNSIWGSVTFKTRNDATSALSLFNISDNQSFEAFPIHQRSQSSSPSEFKVKITWWRRPAKGIAYVVMAWPEDFVSAMQEGKFRIDGTPISINSSKSGGDRDTTNQLFLKGLSYDVTEDEIRLGLSRLITIPRGEIKSRIKDVFIPRENVETSDLMYNALYENIEHEAIKYADRSAFDITFSPDPRHKPKNIRYTVIISFKYPEDGQAALNGMSSNTPSFRDYCPQITAELETSIGIRKGVFEAVKGDLEPAVQFIASTFPNVNAKINTSRAGNIFVNVKSNDAAELARVKVLVHSIVQGDILECGKSNGVSRLFTKDGRTEMAKIEKEIGSVIFVDNRTMTVTVQGTRERRQISLSRIKQYIDGLAGLMEKVILLKGDGKREGLMKEIACNYLHKMKQIAGVHSLKLSYMDHQITILGNEMSIVKTEKLIQEASESLQKNSLNKASDMPDCCVCFCPVEPNDMYRPECCGHPYCNECIKQQIRSAIQHKTFPVVCASENCNQPFVIEDFNSLIHQGCTTLLELIKFSICDFIGRNKTKYRYCITPDCDMIYEITAKGSQFTCSECQQTMCTSCHIDYHNGLSCSMYQAEQKEENKINSWLKEDPVNRKLCPNCRTPIEKGGGCNHMKCASCHIHICWVCLKTFNSDQGCYRHLRKIHGSFV